VSRPRNQLLEVEQAASDINQAASKGELTDESLAALACAGDMKAFEEIFERHRRRIARIVGRFFNRQERIEEIVQDVFAKLYFALSSYTKERGKSFASWLSSIAINACYDELRRARRRPESTMSDVTENEALWLSTRLRDDDTHRDAESEVIARDLANKLLARLSPEDRMVLTLLDGEGQSVNDIAEMTGWSVSKVKVRAHRARHALRRVLSDYV